MVVPLLEVHMNKNKHLTLEERNIIEQRLNEANKLGWVNGIVPNQSFVVPKEFNPIKVKSIEEAFGKIF